MILTFGMLLTVVSAPPTALTRGLELTLAVDSDQLLTGDSVSCRIEFKNTSETAIGLYSSEAINNGKIRLQRMNDSGEWRDCVGPAYVGAGDAGFRWLEPGEKIVALERVSSGNNGTLLFDGAGIDRLRAVAWVPGDEVESNEVEITVKPRDPALVELFRRHIKDQIAAAGGPQHSQPLTPEELDKVKSINDGNRGSNNRCAQVVNEFLADPDNKIDAKSVERLLQTKEIAENRIRTLQALHILANWCRERKDWNGLTIVLAASPERTFAMDAHYREMKNAIRLMLDPPAVGAVPGP